MSRVGFGARLRAVLAAAETIDPYAARVHRMLPATRAAFDRWRRACDAEHERFAVDEPGAAYAALLRGEWSIPEPPRAVADALQLKPAPIVTADMSADELEALWSEMIRD